MRGHLRRIHRTMHTRLRGQFRRGSCQDFAILRRKQAPSLGLTPKRDLPQKGGRLSHVAGLDSKLDVEALGQQGIKKRGIKKRRLEDVAVVDYELDVEALGQLAETHFEQTLHPRVMSAHP